MADEAANKGAPDYPSDVYGPSPYAGVNSQDALISAVASHSAEVEHNGTDAPGGLHGSGLAGGPTSSNQ